MNLLKETLQHLIMCGKTPEDVIQVQTDDCVCTWSEFQEKANFEYDNSWGGIEINPSLVILGKNWWLSRYEYDGSEGWDYNQKPKVLPLSGSLELRNGD